MSTATPPPGINYQPQSFTAPKKSIFQRINFTILIFAGVMLAIVGVPFYIWINAMVTGGIHDAGKYKAVDLKAMSTFDMDQRYASMEDIPLKWRNLEGKEVIMQGDMWAPTVAGDNKLSYFQLVYSKTKCCFNGPPLAQHFVDGDVVPGAAVYMEDNLQVKVWGKVHIYIRKDPDGVIKSIYHVDVTKVEPIKG